MKLLLALFVVAISGYFKSLSAYQSVNEQLVNIVRKYEHLSVGNSEFAAKVADIYYVSKLPDNLSMQKSLALSNFHVYDRQRQDAEDRIKQRINEINSQLPNRNLRKRCRQKLTSQKGVLEKAFKYDNQRKWSLLTKNWVNCAKRLTDDYEYDEDDDFRDYY